MKGWTFESSCKDKETNNYFTSSDPHHDMSGGGYRVRVIIYF